MTEDLSKKHCVPCRGGVPPLKGAQITELMALLGTGWQAVEEHHLEKEYSFEDFAQALDFTNRVGAIAEAEGHHPDIYLAWGKVRLTIWTHKIDGLTESDFILAAKADEAEAG
jgi:4a-hydroxytetrahydrobiopterin dehydratase